MKRFLKAAGLKRLAPRKTNSRSSQTEKTDKPSFRPTFGEIAFPVEPPEFNRGERLVFKVLNRFTGITHEKIQ